MIMRDQRTGLTASFTCTSKGAQDTWVIRKLLESIDNWGYTKVILKTDGEPSIRQVAEEMKKARVHDTIPQSPPACDPAANGVADHAVQDVMGQLRAIKLGIEQRTKSIVATNGPFLQWMVEHAAWTINVASVGHDGKTPRQRLYGKASTKAILEFGEQVLAKPLRAGKTSKKLSLRTRWVHATWLGMAGKTNEHIVAIEHGGAAIKVRTVKRKPMEERWSAETLTKLVATPRMGGKKNLCRRGSPWVRTQEGEMELICLKSRWRKMRSRYEISKSPKS